MSRRSNLELNIPAELSIRKAIDLVEACGANTILTDVVVELDQALTKLSDFVDENIKLAAEAICLIKSAQSEKEVLEAKAVYDQVQWNSLDQEKDVWNDYYGDAKKYLP